MRAFKKIVYFNLLIYATCLVFVNVSENINKFNYLFNTKNHVYKSLDDSNNGSPRIVIFGSSHCELGLSAQTISDNLGIPTFNFCHAGWDNHDKYFYNLLTHLNSNDYLIYVKRINFVKRNEFLNKDLLSFFETLKIIPNIGNYINQSDEIYTLHGDRVYRYKGETKSYEKYNIDYLVINKNIELQLQKIQYMLNSTSSKSPHLIVVTAPILIENIDSFNVNMLGVEFNPDSNLLRWIPPFITNRKDLFYEIRHVNVKGSEIWTSQLIIDLKKILINIDS